MSVNSQVYSFETTADMVTLQSMLKISCLHCQMFRYALFLKNEHFTHSKKEWIKSYSIFDLKLSYKLVIEWKSKLLKFRMDIKSMQFYYSHLF